MATSDRSTNRPAVTQILGRLASGEAGAADELVSVVYQELHQLAQRRIALLAPGQTMQATSLVHEAWERLGAGEAVDWSNRAHFFGAAARAMRFILIEQIRRKRSQKRDGGYGTVPLPDSITAPEAESEFDLELLDEALTNLESVHPRPSQVVMLRYFSGLGMEQIAELLEVSLRTVERDWLFARSWLRSRMEPGQHG